MGSFEMDKRGTGEILTFRLEVGGKFGSRSLRWGSDAKEYRESFSGHFKFLPFCYAKIICEVDEFALGEINLYDRPIIPLSFLWETHWPLAFPWKAGVFFVYSRGLSHGSDYWFS